MTVKSQDEGELIVPGPSVRPRDASSLILLRRDQAEPRVLMGKRHGSHAFMPNKFVFPGGRVDPGDGRARAADSVSAPVMEKLLKARISPTRARGLVMAAVRETFEETGVVIGKASASPVRSRSAHWRPFYATGHMPQLEPLRFIFRAITPPNRTRRFDTRFFLLFADETEASVPDALGGSGELTELDWIPLSKTGYLDLPSITATVLGEVRARVNNPGAARAVPFVRFAYGKPVIGQH